ncbi:hypothetical protein DAEQUDRAFT_662387 [Daedalea quercina L-15889]|uniref:Acyl-CoA desaturase n=1 Tax=Daedalea quercina L-15889 TaxID=1314783 RepID=A0A165TEN9_9APHY|nr:hypothetical protein DAEQUDRAFT_662387 [Daedalea quercina L-15889]
MTPRPEQQLRPRAQIWWANGLIFVATHLAAAIGCYLYPFYRLSGYTVILCVVLFQMGEMSITVGYHRLYSHRAFRASLPVRIAVALFGASAMQGSIKVRAQIFAACMRHRLHHRYTDDPVHDPYAATRGFLWAHMGWIFFKSHYERLQLIDQTDLDNDPVVRMQHKHYLLLALGLGLILPPCIGALWGDATGAFVWAGLVVRLLIWHCTFFVNSLAHWDGLQPYSDENTSKSNLILAVLTCGEGNHNFVRTHDSLFSPPRKHAFPHDYRSGPARYDWDPSKWTILLLKRLGLVWGLKRARPEDVREAHLYMLHKHAGEASASEDSGTGDSSSSDDTDFLCSSDIGTETWKLEDVRRYADSGRCVVVLDGFAVDVTGYLGEHPGGAALLRKYSVRSGCAQEDAWKEADWAFHGGMNNHSRAARRRMRELRVAKLVVRE